MIINMAAKRAYKNLMGAGTSLIHAVFALAGESAGGPAPLYTLAGDVPAVTLWLIASATDYNEDDLAKIAVRCGIPLGLAKPGKEYAAFAGLRRDDRRPSVPLLHLSYLLTRLSEHDVPDKTSKAIVGALRDKAHKVIQASIHVPEDAVLTFHYMDLWTPQELVN